MDHVSTITAPVATLTEKTRWQTFLNSYVQTTYRVMVPMVDTYSPKEVLLDPGMYGTTQDFANELFVQLNATDRPLEELGCVIEDLKIYLEGLCDVQEAFKKFNAKLANEVEAA